MTDHLRLATWNLWWRHGDLEARTPAILATLRDEFTSRLIAHLRFEFASLC